MNYKIIDMGKYYRTGVFEPVSYTHLLLDNPFFTYVGLPVDVIYEN